MFPQGQRSCCHQPVVMGTDVSENIPGSSLPGTDWWIQTHTRLYVLRGKERQSKYNCVIERNCSRAFHCETTETWKRLSLKSLKHVLNEQTAGDISETTLLNLIRSLLVFGWVKGSPALMVAISVACPPDLNFLIKPTCFFYLLWRGYSWRFIGWPQLRL